MIRKLSALAFLAVSAVASVAGAAPAEDDIRDIRGPIQIPEPTSWWPYVLAVALALAVVLAVRELVRRRRTPMSAEAIALRDLDAARGQVESGDAHMFAIAVSNTIRDYVERAFGVHAPTRTTDELLRELMADTSPVAAHRHELGVFLEHCNLAKYARWSLTRDQMTAMLESARTFVRATAASRTAAVPAAMEATS